jgi:NAD(P)-dependent dehydrogenase (short-subunit alcohol dehydrogenase family)
MGGALHGKVAIVTGATRGIGKGIAIGLGEAGAAVYVTGRSTTASPGSLPGTIEETADEVTRAGGEGIAIRCDHAEDADVESLFKRVGTERGRLDVLVNNAFASPAQHVLWGSARFWEMPIELWDDLLAVGLRSHFVATRNAVPLMLGSGGGLVLNVASHAAERPKKPDSKVLISYSVCKAGLRRLTSDMAAELDGTGISVIEVWPPATTTEGVVADQDVFGDLSGWLPPLFTGRVVAAFVADAGPDRSGSAFAIADLAGELGVPVPVA